MNLEKYIRNIPDFPKQGILFRDITPLLLDAEAISFCLDLLVENAKFLKIDKVAAIESRGFIFGSLLAQKLGVGFIPIRKTGKLPFQTYSEKYGLEYGNDILEMHIDATKPGEKILLHDDVLATGGTVLAASKLIEKAGATVAQCNFIIELVALQGKNRISNYDIKCVLQF